MEKDLRVLSKDQWVVPIIAGPSLEQINCGSLQRIADATEKMASSYDNMRNDRDYWKKRAADELGAKEALHRRITALQGVITKLNKRLAATPEEVAE